MTPKLPGHALHAMAEPLRQPCQLLTQPSDLPVSRPSHRQHRRTTPWSRPVSSMLRASPFGLI